MRYYYDNVTNYCYIYKFTIINIVCYFLNKVGI